MKQGGCGKAVEWSRYIGIREAKTRPRSRAITVKGRDCHWSGHRNGADELEARGAGVPAFRRYASCG